MKQRKRREVDPTLTVLRDCAVNADNDAELEAASRAKMEQVLAFMEMISATYEDYKRLPPRHSNA